MAISIKEFYDPMITWNRSELIRDIEKLFKDNQDKAYSILDLQTEFKENYHNIVSSLKLLRRKNVLEHRWYRIQGRRMLFYHWIGKIKEV